MAEAITSIGVRVNSLEDVGARGTVKDHLEALVMQMYKAAIFCTPRRFGEFKKKFILTVLQENKGNQCKAARQLGMHRNTLSRTITELELDAKEMRNGTRRPPRSAHPHVVERKAAR